jgi:hypothetical protein
MTQDFYMLMVMRFIMSSAETPRASLLSFCMADPEEVETQHQEDFLILKSIELLFLINADAAEVGLTVR